MRDDFPRTPFEELHCGMANHRRRIMRSVPRKDPIFTPIFTSIFSSIGISGTIFGVSAASIAGAIATTAVVTGLQMLLTSKPKLPTPDDGKVPLTQSTPYRQWVVGTTRVSGAYMLWEALGSRLFAVQAIAGHRIHGINRWYLHDDQVTIQSDGTVNGLSDGRYGSSQVHLYGRLGNNPETVYSQIVSYLGAQGIWTNDHRGDGQASVAMIATTPKAKDFSKRFPYNIPRLSVEIDGTYVWDFRDPAQDPANPATWIFSNNSALIMCWHWCFNEFGHRRDYTRAILPVLEMWIEEADICDEAVPLASGGAENRYECNGFDSADHDPKIATNAILASCDGWICERGDGALLFTVGKFRESRVEVLTDADISGHQVQYDVLFEDECNRLIPKFTYPATDYTTSDTDFFEDTDRQLASGRVLAQEADYGWVHQWRQARRLGKREWLRIQMRVSGSLDVRLSGVNGVYSRWLRLDTPNRLPRLDGKLIENRKSTLNLTKGGFSMEFGLHPDNIEDWTPAMDEGQQPPVPSAPNSAGLDTAVISSVVAVPNNGTVYLTVTINDPNDSSLTPSVRYRVADTGGGTPGGWVEKVNSDATPSAGSIVLTTDVVPSDKVLEVQAAFINAKGQYSDWSATEDVTSTSDPTPPSPVTGVSITPGAGTATYAWTAPNSSNYAGARLYWNTTNNFSSATAVSPPKYGTPGASYSQAVALTAGVKYGWVVSFNKSGIAGTPAATGAFTVT
ncbi:MULTISPECIES: hypothetical protein [unclassified Rhizobium]